jgi:hypothetical protein
MGKFFIARGEERERERENEWEGEGWIERELCFEQFDRFERALTSGELDYLFQRELTREVLSPNQLGMETDSDYDTLSCITLDKKNPNAQ